MNKYFLTAFSLLAFFFSEAQEWSEDSDGNWVTEQNNVIQFNSSNSNPYGGISFRHNSDTKWLIDFATASTYDLRFLKRENGVISSYMYFDYANDELELTNLNLGIGTASPETKLHVFEESSAATIKVQRGDGGTGHITAGSFGDFRLETPGFTRMIQLESETGDIFFNATGTTPTGSQANLSIIRSTGFVGIGTAEPDSELTVNGEIHTKAVTIDLDGALAPDYVFEESYELRTLEETKTYIETHKHLPEIPSAAEMEKEGIKLKEMNLKLLQKIEELTLHMIQQNEELQRLKSKVEILSNDQ